MTIYGQDLIKRSFIGNQVDTNQFLSSLLEAMVVHRKASCEGRIRIVAEALGVSYSDQEQIKSRSLMTHVFDIAVTDQTVIHPSELFGDLADPVWAYGIFLYHGYLLCE